MKLFNRVRLNIEGFVQILLTTNFIGSRVHSSFPVREVAGVTMLIIDRFATPGERASAGTRPG